jgi:hypothetical protein
MTAAQHPARATVKQPGKADAPCEQGEQAKQSPQ